MLDTQRVQLTTEGGNTVRGDERLITTVGVDEENTVDGATDTLRANSPATHLGTPWANASALHLSAARTGVSDKALSSTPGGHLGAVHHATALGSTHVTRLDRRETYAPLTTAPGSTRATRLGRRETYIPPAPPANSTLATPPGNAHITRLIWRTAYVPPAPLPGNPRALRLNTALSHIPNAAPGTTQPRQQPPHRPRRQKRQVGGEDHHPVGARAEQPGVEGRDRAPARRVLAGPGHRAGRRARGRHNHRHPRIRTRPEDPVQQGPSPHPHTRLVRAAEAPRAAAREDDRVVGGRVRGHAPSMRAAPITWNVTACATAPPVVPRSPPRTGGTHPPYLRRTHGGRR